MIHLAFSLVSTHASLTTLIPNNSIYNEFIYYYYFSDKRRKTWFLKIARTILWHRLSAYYIFQPKIFVVAFSFRWKYRIWWLSSGLWVCATTKLVYVYTLLKWFVFVAMNVILFDFLFLIYSLFGGDWLPVYEKRQWGIR